jgi:hypothetical protein
MRQKSVKHQTKKYIDNMSTRKRDEEEGKHRKQ